MNIEQGILNAEGRSQPVGTLVFCGLNDGLERQTLNRESLLPVGTLAFGSLNDRSGMLNLGWLTWFMR